MKITLQYAERQLRYYQNLVEKLRLTSDASDAKERREKEEASPHTPYKEKEEEERKTTTTTTARARACEGDEKVPSWAPRLDEVLEYAAKHNISTAYARWWYQQMSDSHEWHIPDSNRRITKWKPYLRMWWQCRFKNKDPLEDIEREFGDAQPAKAKVNPFDELRKQWGMQ